MAIFNRTPLFAFFDSQVNPAFWGNTPMLPEVNGFQGWIYGVLGATMAGWGTILAFIIRYPFLARRPLGLERGRIRAFALVCNRYGSSRCTTAWFSTRFSTL